MLAFLQYMFISSMKYDNEEQMDEQQIKLVAKATNDPWTEK